MMGRSLHSVNCRYELDPEAGARLAHHVFSDSTKTSTPYKICRPRAILAIPELEPPLLSFASENTPQTYKSRLFLL
jgi:hypothetical protein